MLPLETRAQDAEPKRLRVQHRADARRARERCVAQNLSWVGILQARVLQGGRKSWSPALTMIRLLRELFDLAPWHVPLLTDSHSRQCAATNAVAERLRVARSPRAAQMFNGLGERK